MKHLRNIAFVLAFGVIFFGLGYNSGKKSAVPAQIPQNAGDFKNDSYSNLDFSLFWDVWDRISRNYIDKKAVDSQKMFYGAISGMVSSLGDPYTVFLPPEQNKEAKDDLGGKFEGIGAQLGVKDKKIVVIAPLKGAPAESAGLLPGDWITEVDGKETYNWTLPEAISKIRGPKGTKVILSIIHKDSQNSVNIPVVRDEIKVASVEWEEKNVECSNDTQSCVIEEGNCSTCRTVVVLKLGRFGDSTYDEWEKAVNDISRKYQIGENNSRSNFGGIVFDLRNNPGGYLSGSTFIASEFISEGNVVIQENADGSRKESAVNRKGKLVNVPMVVLVNKGSASASEIVAGALRVRNKTLIVGETTFGKGTIQEAQDLPKGAGIHITTAKWLLPDGSWINGEGIKPDVEVLNDEKNPDVDVQLNKAIEKLVIN